MAEHTLILSDGQAVTLNTTLTIGRMKKLKNTELFSKELLASISNTPKKDLDYFDQQEISSQAVYIAYYNANEEDPMSLEEFQELLEVDSVFYQQIYMELFGGRTIGKKFSEAFERKTDKTKK